MSHHFASVYGTTSDLGRRSVQQDEALIIEKLFSLPDHNLFAVFDGHGVEGAKVSAFVKDTFPKLLLSNRDNFCSNPQETLKTVFAELNRQLCDNHAIDTYMSGTTAVVAIVAGSTLYVANLGDSRVTIGKRVGSSVKAIAISTDHTCNNATELERVKAAGARVEQLRMGEEFCGPLRIFKGTLPYPGLVCTRTLGDTGARRLGILSEPEVTSYNLTRDQDLFFIVASDGVWDGISNEEVVRIVENEYFANGKEHGAARGDPQKASAMVTKASLEGLDKVAVDDNTTNVVVFFTGG